MPAPTRGAGSEGLAGQLPANTMVFRARPGGSGSGSGSSIGAGEPVHVSYIDEGVLRGGGGVQARRECLAHYFFECRCTRCEADDAAWVTGEPAGFACEHLAA